MSWQYARDLVARVLPAKKPQVNFGYEPDKNPQKSLAAVLESQIGVMEEPPCSNYGAQVARYLHSAGIYYPAPWCAAFVHWGLEQIGKKGYGAYVPSWYIPNLEIQSPRRDAWGLVYFDRLQRYAHIFVVTKVCSNGMIETVEGNTNTDGSREGTGVFRRWRNAAPYRYFATR